MKSTIASILLLITLAFVSTTSIARADASTTINGNGGGVISTPDQTIPHVTDTPPATPGSGTGGHSSGLPTLQNPLKVDSISLVLATVVDLAMNIGIVLATIMIIYAGFRFVWARGNATELAAARQLFMYVIIGLAVLIAAKAIVGIVKNTLVQANVVNPTVFQNP